MRSNDSAGRAGEEGLDLVRTRAQDSRPPDFFVLEVFSRESPSMSWYEGVSGVVRDFTGRDQVDKPCTPSYDVVIADLIGGRNCPVTPASELDTDGLEAL